MLKFLKGALLVFCLFVLAFIIFPASQADAATGTSTWSGASGVNCNWTTAGNWVGTTTPSAGDNLVFPDGTSPGCWSNTNDFASSTSFNSITVANEAGGYVLTGNNIAIVAGIANMNIGSYTNTIGINLAFATTQTITVNAGTLNISGTISGAGGITKTGLGQLTLSGANTFGSSQNVTLSAGALGLGNASALGNITNTLIIGTSTSIQSTAVFVLNNYNQIWNGSFSTINANDINLGAGAVTLGADVTITLGDTLIVGGIVSGAHSLTLTGGAYNLQLDGVNTFGGSGKNFTINSGQINITNASSLGNASTTLVINGGSIVNPTITGFTTNNYPQTWNGSFSLSALGGGGINFGTGAVTMTDNIIIDTFSGGPWTEGGIISGSGFNLTKTGTDILTLNGAVTVKNFTVSAGTLNADSSNINVGGNWSNSGTFTPSSSTVTLVSGIHTITGANTFYNLLLNASNTVTFPASTTQTIGNTFSCAGSAGNLITIDSSLPGVQATLSRSAPTVISCDYLSLTDSNATGGAAWHSGPHSTTSNITGWNATLILTYTAGAHGSISGATLQTVAPGADGTQVIAVPDSGYHFTGWDDGVLTAARTETNVTADHSPIANFGPGEIVLTQQATSTTGHPSGATSTTITLASPATAGGLIVTGVATDKNAGAYTVPAGFTQIGSQHIGTSTSRAMAYKVAVGGETTITWEYTTGHSSVAWAGEYSGLATSSPLDVSAEAFSAGDDGGSGGAVTSQTTGTTTVTSQKSEFAIAMFGIDSGVNANGSRTWTNGFTETSWSPEADSRPGLSVSTKILSATGTQETTVSWGAADQASAAIVTFKTETFTLTYTAGAHGSITGATSQVVDYGESGTAVTAVPSTGYHFVNWSDASTSNPRTDSDVTGNISVTANFAINTYTLAYTPGANGSITGSSTQVVNYGASGTAVTASSSLGYHFVNWSDGTTTNPRTDTNVTADISVTANFAINTYTLTYTAGTHGSLTGSTTQVVNHGNSGTAVTASSSLGYHFTAWSDGTTTNPRTDVNVTGPVTVTASFSINPSSDKAITAFSFASPAVTGTINESAKTVTLTVPYGTNLTALVPTITTTGASVNPNTGVAHNFTATSTYTVTAADSSTQSYTVTVTVSGNTTTRPPSRSHLPQQTIITGGYRFINDLTVGSTGTDVVELQKILIADGYLVMPPGVPLGTFGALTRAAVIKYQLANGIVPAVGFVGPITRAKLNGEGSMSTSAFIDLLISLGIIASDKVDLVKAMIW